MLQRGNRQITTLDSRLKKRVPHIHLEGTTLNVESSSSSIIVYVKVTVFIIHDATASLVRGKMS